MLRKRQIACKCLPLALTGACLNTFKGIIENPACHMVWVSVRMMKGSHEWNIYSEGLGI